MIPLTVDRPGLAYAAAAAVLSLALGGLAIPAAGFLDHARTEHRELGDLSRLSVRADALRARADIDGRLAAARGAASGDHATMPDLRDWLNAVADDTGITIDTMREDGGGDAPERAALTMEGVASEEGIADFLSAMGEADAPVIVLGYAIEAMTGGYYEEGYEQDALSFSLQARPLAASSGEEE